MMPDLQNINVNVGTVVIKQVLLDVADGRRRVGARGA